VIRALVLLKEYADSKVHTSLPDEDIPPDAVVRGPWQEAITGRGHR
jgi:hypothetical protein